MGRPGDAGDGQPTGRPPAGRRRSAERGAEPLPEATARQVAELAALNGADLLRAFGLTGAPAWLRRAALRPFRGRVRRLAEQLAGFDADVARLGIAKASRGMVARLVPTLASGGSPPRSGPLLVVANHPGLFDALAVFAGLGRRDVSVVALDHPFLRALPNLSEHVIPVPEAGSRAGVLRAVAGRLKAGEAVVTFPAGTIEPDPEVRAEAASGLGRWSPSGSVLLRLAPDAVVVPAVVGGVHTARALDHPLTRLRRRPEDRAWLAAVAQLVWPSLRTDRVSVRWGTPTRDADDVLTQAAALMRASHRPPR